MENKKDERPPSPPHQAGNPSSDQKKVVHLTKNANAYYQFASVKTRILSGLLDWLVLFLMYELMARGYLGPWLQLNIRFIYLFIPYWIIFSFLFRNTLGYLMLGLNIVNKKGKNASRKQVMIRLLALVFSLLPVCVGFFLAFIDPKAQTWHDKIAKTFVVHTDDT